MTLKVAILGAGIGREHFAAYSGLPEFCVKYVVDQDLPRAQGVVSETRTRAVKDIASVLADPEIDIVDVCLPPHLHVPITLDALTAGKHVICEKPLCTSLSDANRLKLASVASGRAIYPVFQYRWGPSLSKLRHLINCGLAGKPQTAALETHWSRGADYYAVPWRGTWAGEQGGAVLGHAIHNHDLLTHFFGPVATVSASTATRINPIETEDCAAITFAMVNGALATSSITLGAASNESRIRLVFEHLTATSGTEPYAPGIEAWSFLARDPDHQGEIDTALKTAPSEPVGFKGFLTEIAKHIHDGKSNHVTLADGIASIELVTAIYHAARTGARVSLPLAIDHPLYEGWQP